jgi:hypothetical protein
MLLLKVLVSELGLVWDYDSTKRKVIVPKEVFEDIQIEFSFCRRDFLPLDLEFRRKAVLGFDCPYFFCDFASVIQRTPDGSQDHGIVAVILQMATFIAIYIIRFCHSVSPKR